LVVARMLVAGRALSSLKLKVAFLPAAFLAGWILKRPDFVQKIISKIFTKK
jgi:hypothetical protein